MNGRRVHASGIFLGMARDSAARAVPCGEARHATQTQTGLFVACDMAFPCEPGVSRRGARHVGYYSMRAVRYRHGARVELDRSHAIRCGTVRHMVAHLQFRSRTHNYWIDPENIITKHAHLTFCRFEFDMGPTFCGHSFLFCGHWMSTNEKYKKYIKI